MSHTIIKCHLKPTTSHHTVQGFHPICQRRTFPTLNQSTWCHVYVHFKLTQFCDTSTCVTYSKPDTLNDPGVLCHLISKQVDDGPLWGHTMPDRRVIFDFVHFKFMICIVFALNHTQQWFVSHRGSPSNPAPVIGMPVPVFLRGCLLKSSMRSGDMARNCRGKMSIGNLQGHTPCVLYCVPSRTMSRPNV